MAGEIFGLIKDKEIPLVAEVFGGEVDFNGKVVTITVKVKLPYGEKEEEIKLSIENQRWDDISEYLKPESPIHLILECTSGQIGENIKGVWLNATEKKSLWIRLDRAP